MTSTFLTSDLHLGDSRFDIMQRPFKNLSDFHSCIIDNYNSIVSDNDNVIINGDVIYKEAKDPEKLIEFLRKFKGKKTLIKGNHDVFDNSLYFKVFDQVIKEGNGLFMNVQDIRCWITHYPTKGREDCFNIVGHIHSSWKVQKNFFNCGVDVNHFRPVNASFVPFILNSIESFYDDDVWIYNNIANQKHEDQRGKKGSYADSLNK